MIQYVPEEVENLIWQVISAKDADVAESHFSSALKTLLKGELKYNVFSKLYPNNTCYDVFIRLENIGTYSEYLLHPSKHFGKWHGTNYGSEVIIYSGPDKLTTCLSECDCSRNMSNNQLSIFLQKSISSCCNGFSIYLSYNKHAGILWIDRQNKTIDRYDSFFSANETPEQNIIDFSLKLFFKEHMPSYTYLGNMLTPEETIQSIRQVQWNRWNADNFCQDYSILYSIRRINGMSYKQAAQHLVASEPNIIEECAQLLRQMWYIQSLT